MGFNLLDVMLGSSIFLFGVLASAPLLTESARASHRASKLLEATTLAQKRMSLVRNAIRSGRPAGAGACDEDDYQIIESIGGNDPDFYRVSIAILSKSERRMLVELIGLVEKPS